MIASLATVDPKRVPLFAAAAVALVAAAAVSYVVLPQLKAHRAAGDLRATLAESVGSSAALVVEHARLQDEVLELEHALQNDGGGLPQHALEAFLIGRLQDVAHRSAIQLESVEPTSGEDIGGVHETLFEIELTGEYATVHAWLRTLRHELVAVVPRELVLAPVDDSPNPRLRATVLAAAYRNVE